MWHSGAVRTLVMFKAASISHACFLNGIVVSGGEYRKHKRAALTLSHGRSSLSADDDDV